MRSRRIVLLGPQYGAPTAGAALAELGVRGPVATITAGWQEREDEDQMLQEQLDGPSINLRLYHRAQQVWEADPELQRAHHAMQVDLKTLRELHSRQLEAAAVAWVGLLEAEAPEHLVGPERDAALRSIQRLDAHLLERIRSIRADFERQVSLTERSAVAAERTAIEKTLAEVEAVVVEGGHVAVLLNRLALFGVGQHLAGKTVVGCAGGAMALCGRVLLYDDSPAIGRGHAEVALPGLGLAPGVIALPDAAARLRTTDPARMRRLSLRLAPDSCALLDPGARLVWDGSSWSGTNTRLILPDGMLVPWESAA